MPDGARNEIETKLDRCISGAWPAAEGHKYEGVKRESTESIYER